METNQIAHRAVVGGTGEYLGVTGAQHQSWIGFNTSIFPDGTGNSQNFRNRFDLIQPDI